MADNSRDEGPKYKQPFNPIDSLITLMAHQSHKNLSDAELRNMGYKVKGPNDGDDVPGVEGWRINQALIAKKAREMKRNSSEGGRLRWITEHVTNANVRPENKAENITEVKVAPRVLVLGGQPMENGRLRVNFRAKPNPNARTKDGMEHAQTEFGNTAYGQVMGHMAREAKGKIVNAIIEMEPMKSGDSVRTLRDIVVLRDLTREDMERLEIDDAFLAQYNITPPQS